MGVLYKLDFDGGKSYIGITTRTAQERYDGHANDARRGASNAVYAAWRKHGAPRLRVLAILEKEQLALAEMKAIAVYETVAPKGYNLSAGGELCSSSNHPETKAKMSVSMKKRWLDPSYKAKVSAGLKAVWREDWFKKKISSARNVPEMKAKTSAAMKLAHGKPESKLKSAMSAVRRWQNAESRKAVSDKSKEKWTDPSYRSKTTAAIRAGQNTTACREKMSQATKRLQHNPAYIEKNLTALRAAVSSPECRLKTSLAAKRRWQDPQYREKVLEARRVQRASKGLATI